MAECASHQKNPQIPKKMDKFKEKMISHLQTQARYNNELFQKNEVFMKAARNNRLNT